MNKHWRGFEVFDQRDDDPQFSEPPPRAEVTLTPATSIQALAIHWLWPGWLAVGKLHILGGQPGTGKTTLAILIAAIVTHAGRWPDGTFALAGNVVIWSGEDDPADTLLPRLIASGADRSRVFFVTGVQERGEHRSFDPAKDMLALRAAITAIKNVRLIIVDPIVSAVQGDSHKNAETRRGLAPLVELASHIGAALVGITHFSKGTSGREPVERITGSLAFGALARIVLIAAKEPDAEDGIDGRRIFARAKSNIGPDEGGFAYRLEQVPMPGDDRITASIAIFGEPIEGSARDMLAVADAHDEQGAGSARQEAEAFLLDLLLDGPTPAKTVKTAASAAALPWITVRRAKENLGVITRKGGMDQGWVWSVPAEGAHQTTKGLTPEGMSPFGKNEHLRAETEAIEL
jgi:putative DNA primase/helicase